MPSATIKIFLVHGDPKRLRTAELSNWNGKAVAGPRSEFDIVLARDESENSGVYFLTGNDPETGKSAVYIGEAESIRDRVKIHLNKDFWNQIVFFTSKDENLTKAHFRYLEGRLIEQTKEALLVEPSAKAVSGHPSGRSCHEVSSAYRYREQGGGKLARIFHTKLRAKNGEPKMERDASSSNFPISFIRGLCGSA